MIIISELKELLNKVQEVRKHMTDLIADKSNLLDQEVLTASEMVDTLLNEYEKIIRKKK